MADISPEEILLANARFWEDAGLLSLNQHHSHCFSTSSAKISSLEANYTYVSGADDLKFAARCAYFLEDCKERMVGALEREGFVFHEKDVVMCGSFGVDECAIPDIEGLEIRRCDTTSHPDFIGVFRAAFYNGSGSSPYSQIDRGYLDVYTADIPDGHRYDHFHYLAYLDSHPVAIFSVIADGNCAGIYDVCMKPDVQGGRHIMDHLFLQATKDFCDRPEKVYFGITAAGSALERWYRMKGGAAVAYTELWERRD